MKSVALHNLGCKVNSYEIEVMQQMLQEKGYTIVPFDEIADIYIVNTCTVTNIADRKSRQMLHRAKQKNPAALVVAVGCYVQTGREDVEQDPCIDLAIGNNRKKDLASILEEYLRDLEQEDAVAENAENAGHGVDKTMHDTTVIDINHTAEYEEMTLKQTAEHTRAYIKIQDGCNQFCSYCVIPYARGRVRSRRAEDIIREITGMAKNGYREIVLTGIHISSYGIDFDEEAWKRGESVSVLKEDEERRDYSGSSKLIDLLERIHDIEGIERIRIGSLEPRIVTEETAARMAALPKLCPHFHLSLQSGCDATLRRMNRKYTSEEYAESVALLRKVFDHPAITTDVIVGFPGETEEVYADKAIFRQDSILRDAYFQVFQAGRYQSGRDVSPGAGSRENHKKRRTSGYGERAVEAIPGALSGQGSGGAAGGDKGAGRSGISTGTYKRLCESSGSPGRERRKSGDQYRSARHGGRICK